VQVIVACLWANASNRLLLPWSSGDWCRERLAGAYEAAAQLLGDACELQLQAYRHLQQTAAAAASGDTCAPDDALRELVDGNVVVLHIDSPLQQPAAPATQQEVHQQLQQQRASLHGSIVAPLVAEGC
jgi:hypothetical protein